MDSFRQSSLYDAFGRQSGTSSIMNSASNASSRLASPGVSSSALGRTGAPHVASKPSLSSKNGTPASFDDNSSAANAYPGMMGYYGYGNMGNGSQYGLSAPYTASNANSSVNLSSNQALAGTGTPEVYPQLGAFGYAPASFAGANYGNQYGGYDSANYANGATYANGDNYNFSDSRRSSVITSATGTSPLAAARGLDPNASVKSVPGLGIGAGGVPGLNGAPVPASHPPLPDLNQIVLPGTIFWHYIDLSCQEQGPFNGLQMNGWREFLMDSTLLRRHNDQLFVSFAVLKQVFNTDQPFIVELTAAAWNEHIQLAQQREQSAAADPNSEEEPSQISNGFGEETESSADAGAEKVAKPAVNDASSSPATSPNANAAKVAKSESSFSETPTHQSPPSPANASASAHSKPETVANSLTNLHVSSTEPTKKVVARESSASAEHRRAEPANAPASDPWKKPARSAQVKIADIKQQAMENQKKKATESSASRKTGQGRWMPLEQVTPGAGSPLLPNSPQFASSSLSSPPIGSPVLNGNSSGVSQVTWGKKQVTPARSLADVQREQKELQQQQQQQKARSMAAALAPAHNLAAAASLTKNSTEEAKSGRFAALDTPTPSTSTTARETLASARSPHPNAAASGNASTLRNPERNHAPVANGMVVNGNNQLHPSETATNEVSTGHSKPRTARPAPMSITARASMASPADELVHWVRVSFKDLVKGVDSMELLDVFLSLGNNKAAKEFIAESIYEYSKSLDGRKFASDFLSRKKTAEESMRFGETWKDVLSRFNPHAVVETDPSFKVVSKKRTQKIARPGDGF